MSFKISKFKRFDEQRRQEVIRIAKEVIKQSQSVFIDINKGELYLDGTNGINSRLNNITRTIDYVGEEMEMYCPQLLQRVGDSYMSAQNVALQMEHEERVNREGFLYKDIKDPNTRNKLRSPVTEPCPLALRGTPEEMELVKPFEERRFQYATLIEQLDIKHRRQELLNKRQNELNEEIDKLRNADSLTDADLKLLESVTQDLRSVKTEISGNTQDIELLNGDVQRISNTGKEEPGTQTQDGE